MADKRVVYLKFATVDGKSASITISGPRTGLTLEQAKTAANALVANKVILGSGDAPLATLPLPVKYLRKVKICNKTTYLCYAMNILSLVI